ncbi:hypothetical protein GQ43DRAFT_28127 [Delitschia confertaspora ATCC 74209]|uniref:Uncharacterized protein n=1 Tax=Delitschia confertaspora ATCC 74209 TaxID=1513339 RepID=A0A9P4JLU4_9PLEO|nr:hypothetical protein GQ43DRAFT_28127 [Delitschia confertaspora ATCC 74209]
MLACKGFNHVPGDRTQQYCLTPIYSTVARLTRDTAQSDRKTELGVIDCWYLLLRGRERIQGVVDSRLHSVAQETQLIRHQIAAVPPREPRDGFSGSTRQMKKLGQCGIFIGRSDSCSLDPESHQLPWLKLGYICGLQDKKIFRPA